MRPAVAPQKRPAATPKAGAKAKAVGKAVQDSWPPWIHRTAETLERGRALLPPGARVPEDQLPDVPSFVPKAGAGLVTERLKSHLLYRYSERAVRATSFRPERFTEYCLGRLVQVAHVHVSDE